MIASAYTYSTNDADRTQTFRVLVEIAALDEARALKLLTAQARAGAEDEMCPLCGEVDRFAARHGIDLTRGLSRFWVVEFHKPRRRPVRGGRGRPRRRGGRGGRARPRR